jgi:hypothetical protein
MLRKANTNPNNGPASNKIDPFNTLPVGERGNFQYLARNCKLPVALLLFLITIKQFILSSTLLNARTPRLDQRSKKKSVSEL